MNQKESQNPAARSTHRNQDHANGTSGPAGPGFIGLLFRVAWGMFKFLFTLVINHNFFALMQMVLLFGVVSAFGASLLYFLHGEYFSFKQATFALPGFLLNTAFNASSTALMFSYCHFPLSPQWGCPRPPLFPDKVIEGIIDQVGEARDIFDMITQLGKRGSESVSGTSSIQYCPGFYE
jgi:hypothetical protein